MTPLDDAALSRLREALREPDLSGTRYRLRSVAGRGGSVGLASAMTAAALVPACAIISTSAADRRRPG